METEETKPKECAACQRELDLGVDAITLSYGVVGPRGIVPLRDAKLFCSESCLESYVCDEHVEALPRRIP